MPIFKIGLAYHCWVVRILIQSGSISYHICDLQVFSPIPQLAFHLEIHFFRPLLIPGNPTSSIQLEAASTDLSPLSFLQLVWAPWPAISFRFLPMQSKNPFPLLYTSFCLKTGSSGKFACPKALASVRECDHSWGHLKAVTVI